MVGLAVVASVVGGAVVGAGDENSPSHPTAMVYGAVVVAIVTGDGVAHAVVGGSVIHVQGDAVVGGNVHPGPVVGARVVNTVVGAGVVGGIVVVAMVVGARVVGAKVVGDIVVGANVVGPSVVGGAVVGAGVGGLVGHGVVA